MFEYDDSADNNYQEPDANMALWLNFDNSSVVGDSPTKAVDRSKNKNGTITNVVYSSTAKFGKSVYFDGNSDYIDFGDYDNANFGTNPFTITFWIKGGDDLEALIMKDNWLGDDNGLYIQTELGKYIYYDGLFDTTIGAIDNEWHHIAVSREGTGADELFFNIFPEYEPFLHLLLSIGVRHIYLFLCLWIHASIIHAC